MEGASLAGLIGSWRLIAVRFRMSDNGEVIDEPIEDVDEDWVSMAKNGGRETSTGPLKGAL